MPLLSDRDWEEENPVLVSQKLGRRSALRRTVPDGRRIQARKIEFLISVPWTDERHKECLRGKCQDR